MTKINFLKPQVLFLLLTLLLTGCGFHLRGDLILPELYQRIYLVDNGNNDIAKPLRAALESVGTKLEPTPESATSVVTILSSGVQRRALNVAGKSIREYELQLNVSFVVQDHEGKQVAGQETVSVIRNFRNNNTNVLGSDNEEQIIRREMNQSAVIKILRRMKAIAEYQ